MFASLLPSSEQAEALYSLTDTQTIICPVLWFVIYYLFIYCIIMIFCLKSIRSPSYWIKRRCIAEYYFCRLVTHPAHVACHAALPAPPAVPCVSPQQSMQRTAVWDAAKHVYIYCYDFWKFPASFLYNWDWERTCQILRVMIGGLCLY